MTSAGRPMLSFRSHLVCAEKEVLAEEEPGCQCNQVEW